MNNQKKYKGYVACLDMLGFKSVMSKNPNKASQSLRSLESSMNRIKQFSIEVSSTNEKILDRIRTYNLDDSILIYTLNNQPQDFISILILTSELRTY
jgi:hypothetical protein